LSGALGVLGTPSGVADTRGGGRFARAAARTGRCSPRTGRLGPREAERRLRTLNRSFAAHVFTAPGKRLWVAEGVRRKVNPRVWPRRQAGCGKLGRAGHRIVSRPGRGTMGL